MRDAPPSPGASSHVRATNYLRLVLIQPQVNATTKAGITTHAVTCGAVASKVRLQGPRRTVVRDTTCSGPATACGTRTSINP